MVTAVPHNLIRIFLLGLALSLGSTFAHPPSLNEDPAHMTEGTICVLCDECGQPCDTQLHCSNACGYLAPATRNDQPDYDGSAKLNFALLQQLTSANLGTPAPPPRLNRSA